MTAKEAIAQLNAVVGWAMPESGEPIWFVESVNEAVQMAIEALEKQMPKPYTTDIDTSWGVRQKMPLCPECDHFIGYHRFIHGDNREVTYCEHCGQAIDWSDTDD